MIELVQVRKVFNQGRDNEFRAIDGIDLALSGERLTVFKGPSGSGKTTLLTLIGCLARPTAGRVRLSGKDISGLPERFLTDLRRRTFGFVFQQFNLVRGLTVLENVMLPAYPLGLPRTRLAARAAELLESVRLGHKARSQVEVLSGGEAQRVAIARALVNDPPVLIADEPTANLDTALSHEVLGILDELKQAGKTLLMTSHDPRVFESAMVDRVVELRDGRIAEAAA